MKYDLMIEYRNGEIDRYYSRLTGEYWESDCSDPDDAFAEMKAYDAETFAAIAECENVIAYWAERV